MNTKGLFSLALLASPILSLPAPYPNPLLGRMMGAAPALLQGVVTGGTGAGAAGAGAGAAGGVATGGVATGVVPGVATGVVTTPAMMAMSTMLPGVALGILKALFIAQLTETLKKPEKSHGYGYPQPQSYGYEHQQPEYGHGHGHGRRAYYA